MVTQQWPEPGKAMTAPTDDAALIADLHLRFRSPYQIDEATCRRAADRLEELQAELAAKNTAGEACMTALAVSLERERGLREDNDILRATCTAREEYAADIAALRADAERLTAYNKELNKELWLLKWDWIEATGHLVMQPVQAGTDLSRVLAANAQFCKERDTIVMCADDTKRLEWLIAALNDEQRAIDEHGECDFHSMFSDDEEINRAAIDAAIAKGGAA